MINVYHFRMDEIQDPERPIVSKLYICLLLTIISVIMNFIVMIYSTITIGFSLKAVLYGVINLGILPMVAVYTFQKGMRCVVDQPRGLLFYTIC